MNGHAKLHTDTNRCEQARPDEAQQTCLSSLIIEPLSALCPSLSLHSACYHGPRTVLMARTGTVQSMSMGSPMPKPL